MKATKTEATVAYGCRDEQTQVRRGCDGGQEWAVGSGMGREDGAHIPRGEAQDREDEAKEGRACAKDGEVAPVVAELRRGVRKEGGR